MAKEIKVIKCPQCGSTVKTEIKPDFYRCSSCQTEYFLDDNDVTINYNHNYNNNQNLPFNNGKNNKVIKAVAIAFGAFILLTILINAITYIFSSSTPEVATSATSPKEKEDHGFDVSRYTSEFFIQPGSNSAVVAVSEDRRYKAQSDKQKDGLYLGFYSPNKKKLIGEQRIEGDHDHLSSMEVTMKTFSDGNLYVIAGNSKFYVVDKVTLKLIDAGKKFFSANDELQVGVATVEFVYEDSGDGLILLTNDGKKLYYYPLVQKLYTEDKYNNAKNGFKTLLSGAKEKVIYCFTSKSTDYPEANLQLLKIRYKDNGAGPKNIVDNVSWGKDYGGSGLFTDRDPYRKVLFQDFTMESDRILDWKDLTPGRLYFEPNVRFDDGNLLLISFKANANPNSGYKLQQLNNLTGAVEWTTDQPTAYQITKMIRSKGIFLGMTNEKEIIAFDAKGKVISNYKIE